MSAEGNIRVNQAQQSTKLVQEAWRRESIYNQPNTLFFLSAPQLRGASRVYSIDHIQDRLDLAESIGVIPINFDDSDPVEQVLAREPNGMRRGVEAVGFEAIDRDGELDPGNTLRSLLGVTAQSGGIGIVGLFISTLTDFSIGQAFEKRISINGGVVLPLQVSSELVPLVTAGIAHPSFIISSVIDIE